MKNRVRRLLQIDLILTAICAVIGVIVGLVGENDLIGICEVLRSTYLLVGGLALMMTAVMLITDNPRNEHRFGSRKVEVGGIPFTILVAEAGIWLLLIGIAFDYLVRWFYDV